MTTSHTPRTNDLQLEIDRLDLTDGRYHVSIGTYPRGFDRAGRCRSRRGISRR